MKRTVAPIALVALTIVGIVASIYWQEIMLYAYNGGQDYKRGMPNYVNGQVHFSVHDEGVEMCNEVDILARNILVMFIVFNIPIFLAGYLAGRNRTVSNQGMDLTR